MNKRMIITMASILILAQSLFAAVPGNPEQKKGPLIVHPDGVPDSSIAFWLETSLNRVFPTSKPGDKQTLMLTAARNSTIAFQACLRNQRVHPLKISCAVTGPEDINIRVRRVGFVPVQHHTSGVPVSDQDGLGHIPGLVPDPLFPDQSTTVGPWENQSFWITLKIPAGTEPGVKDLKITFTFHGTQTAELNAKVDVREFTVKPRKDFPVTNWWRAEAIHDWYKTEPFDDEWFKITKPYIKNMIDHGSNAIYVPSFFMRRELFKRPGQMVKVVRTKTEQGFKYDFDFSITKRFLDMAKECGTEYFEWPHFWIYWGARHPVPVYEEVNGQMKLLWPTLIDGHGEVYTDYLAQFLPVFHDFLKAEGVLDKSFFHLSDEPGPGEHLENYKKGRATLRKLAPWMKVMDALSDIEYGRQGLTDIPIPSIASAPAYINEKIPHWVYYCCGPTGSYLQRVIDTPLAKLRMGGVLFYHLKADGFLHWGYNYWHKMETEIMSDPFTDLTGDLWPLIPAGDPFVVYPGTDGPIDSIRWEVFAESLQDYAILQTAGIDPDDEIFKGVNSYADFPKNEEWITKTINDILTK